MNLVADAPELPIRVEVDQNGGYILVDDRGRRRAHVDTEEDAALFAAALVHCTISVQPTSVVFEVPFRLEPRKGLNLYCPNCGRHIHGAKVLDSRPVTTDLGAIRRRRECRCGLRLKTYEYVHSKVKLTTPQLVRQEEEEEEDGKTELP